MFKFCYFFVFMCFLQASENNAPSSSGADKTLNKQEKPNSEKTNDDSKKKAVTFNALSESAEEDIKVFMNLAERHKELESKEESIKKEFLLLKAAEKSLDEKLNQFNLLKSDLDKLLKKLDERESKQTTELVKMYEAMKPKQAANIFNRIELELSIQIIKLMNKKKASMLLAAMDVQKAKDITQGLVKETQNISAAK